MFYSLLAFLPEIGLLLTACALLLDHDRLLKHPLISFVWVLFMAGILAVLIVNPGLHGEHFCGTMGVDLLTLSQKGLILAFGLPWIEKQGESIALYLLSLLGVCIVISSHHMITAYVGLELHVLPLYGIIALRRDRPFSMEASLKYFILGTLASLFILYGMGLVYASTGRMDLGVFQGQTGHLFQGGLFFIMAGILFKLAIVPFHGWIGDVYEGSTNDQVAFMGVVSKCMALFLLFRLVQGSTLLSWLAVASIVMGAFMALRQHNIRRLFAYGSIHHMGFVLVGLDVSFSCLLYFLVYAFAFNGFFFILKIGANKGHPVERVEDFKGLFERKPLHAGFLALMVFVLAGIPPLPGFWTKFNILIEIAERGQYGQAFLALGGSLVALVYYLNILRVMFFEGDR